MSGAAPMRSLRDAFDLLVDVPAAERGERVRSLDLSGEEASKVLAMLEADDAGASVMAVPVAAAIEQLKADDKADDAALERLVGTKVGSFLLRELIGEGGSSVVFRAERAAGQGGSQIAALKMLRLGLFSTSAERRFRREHAILAQLNHPNIARLIEGGVSDAGFPYIAMELVDGQPITRSADRRALGIEARLKLFARLCRTVDAAHAALVIHRDLKPSNVLVDARGELKVLDFGIAKLQHTEQDTERTHTISLTPEYAAPEQFHAGHQTVAVDVFALGVILGELLTGRRVRDTSMSSAVLDSGDAPPNGLPSRELLARRLRGDLDAIARMATAEEPARRYRSAEALAADVERHLAGKPITARPPSTWYWLRKFVSRHRMGVAAATLVAVALLSTFGAALWQADLARQEATRANAVRDLVVTVFESARAGLPRDERPTPEALVAQASVRLAAVDGLDAATRADLDRTLGEVWLSLASYAEADAAFKRALAHAIAIEDRVAVNELRVLQAEGWQALGHNADTERVLRPMLAALREPASPMLVRALRVLVEAEMALGQREPALAHQREAAEVALKVFGPDSLDTIAAQLEIGGALAVAGRYAEAVDAIEPLLGRWHEIGGRAEDVRYLSALTNLAVAGDGLGRLDDSEARLREVLEVKRRIYTGPHQSIAKSMRDLAGLLQRRGQQPAETEALLTEALAMQREVLGPDHVEVVKTLDMLGVHYAQQARFTDAEAHYQAVIAICAGGAIHEDVCPRSRANLGQTYFRQERLVDAERELRAALAERTALYGDEHPNTAISKSRLSIVLADLGHSAEAGQLAIEALALFEGQGQGQSREAAVARMAWARALERGGEHDSALLQIERALEMWNRVAKGEIERRVTMLVLKAQILRSLGNADAARTIAREAGAFAVPSAKLWPVTRRELADLTAD